MMTSVLHFGVHDVKAHVTREPAGSFLRNGFVRGDAALGSTLLCFLPADRSRRRSRVYPTRLRGPAVRDAGCHLIYIWNNSNYA